MPASPPAKPPSPTFEQLRAGGVLGLVKANDPAIFLGAVQRDLGSFQGLVDSVIDGADVPVDQITTDAARIAGHLRTIADAVEAAARIMADAPTATEWRPSQTGGDFVRTFTTPKRVERPRWGAPPVPKGGNA